MTFATIGYNQSQYKFKYLSNRKNIDFYFHFKLNNYFETEILRKS
jgi:hypothetical protein